MLHSSQKDILKHSASKRLEALTATKFDKITSVDEPRQFVEIQRFGDLCIHHQGSEKIPNMDFFT